MINLGNFSVSLAVKDLAVSQAFYKKLGFEAVFGEPSSGWVIMRNGAATLGLFQGMFEGNILTFNPGWDANGQELADYEDVRTLQRRFKDLGITMAVEADETSQGPAHCILVDPDGNTIMLDQHV